MLGSAEQLVKYDEIQLAVATPTPLVKELTFLKGAKMSYYLLPYGKGNCLYNKEYESYWKYINEEFHPDVVHIHGTEFTHGLSFVKACGSNNVVVSIQGLVSVIADYYLCGLKTFDVFRNITERDLIVGTLFHDRKEFSKRGKYEIELLQSVNHVIGRTSWDKAHIWAINPHVQYHFCNETLRPEFYNGDKWEYTKCVPHSIFLSQANYPIKGIHVFVKAIPLIQRDFPNVSIRVAGQDICSVRKFKGIVPIRSGYEKYVSRLIKRLNVEGRIEFVGRLNAEEMKQEYLKCNVFVCPSSVENSPNSLGEAQILGTPCVCSYAGGVPDLMKGYEKFMYRFEDAVMLAKNICDIFKSTKNQVNMIDIARKRHDREDNAMRLIEIYTYIENNSSKSIID